MRKTLNTRLQLRSLASISLIVNTILFNLLLMLTIKQKSDDYPKKLLRLHKPPTELYIKSTNWVDIMQMPTVSVVGTRRPSHYAGHVCRKIVSELAVRGVCIVSGLALGIDSIAHRAALDAGGTTVAVIPSGFNYIAPTSHSSLAREIVGKGGALVSEYPPNTKISNKGVFVARNRIVAALSDAVLIPEAGAKSGSLHTAKFAIELGIDVLAIPGHITNPQAEGCHSLIQTGAGLITSAQDVLNCLHIPASESKSETSDIHGSTVEETKLLQLIASGINEGEDLAKMSGLAIDTYGQTMTMLEISGRIRAGGGNSWYLN